MAPRILTCEYSSITKTTILHILKPHIRSQLASMFVSQVIKSFPERSMHLSNRRITIILASFWNITFLFFSRLLSNIILNLFLFGWTFCIKWLFQLFICPKIAVCINSPISLHLQPWTCMSHMEIPSTSAPPCTLLGPRWFPVFVL